MTVLDRLAATAGIELEWVDIFGKKTQVPDDTKRALLSAMGFDVTSEDALQASLRAVEERPWRRILPPALVVTDQASPSVELTLPETSVGVWTVVEEGTGAEHSGAFEALAMPAGESRMVDGVLLRRRRLNIPLLLPIGYHRLVVRTGGGLESTCTLIVAPERCMGPQDVDPDQAFWGIAVQLYGLRSERGWGIGDFHDLAEFSRAAAAQGAGVLGLNPLHAQFPADPGHFSPYSPSNRAFLNAAYIDVAGMPEFAECPDARIRVGEPGFQAELAAARSAERVDYAAVARLKLPVLAMLHRRFRELHGTDETERGKDFRFFRAERGEALDRQALFDALHEHVYADGAGAWMWREWPEGLRRPDSPDVRRFAEENAERVDFFAWLQWVADRQLAAAQAEARNAGMPIGLYVDLAVAEHPGGATAWSFPDVVLSGVSVGAPPDLLNSLGQNWGLSPLSPWGLAEAGYAPFIEVLRASMRHAGAIRIDHVMSLMRLFWIPEGRPGNEGAYVRYPLDDLVRIIALESRRNRCLVIGEDLGTVPEGFRPRMQTAGILSYRVLWFERDADQEFLQPGAYPSQALVTASTHDLPTLPGWWDGRDLAWRARLEFYPEEAARLEEGHNRYLDRFRLLDALDRAGLLPPGIDRTNPPAQLPPELAAAVYRYLARTAGRILMVGLEDLAGAMEQPNLPGTVDEHPNWRRRTEVPLDRIFDQPMARAILDAIRAERPTVGG
ncbi:MAG TPA: 4-alpha-glucanotransferase [Azospirillaceae bacterium]|nr:4-alpha-glucanotransferase [Azospirillaceae bacterium]